MMLNPMCSREHSLGRVRCPTGTTLNSLRYKAMLTAHRTGEIEREFDEIE